MDTQRLGFAKLPNSLDRTPEITSGALIRLLVVIYNTPADAKGWRASSIRKFTERLGFSPSSRSFVRGLIRQAQELGLLEVEQRRAKGGKGPQRASRYRLLYGGKPDATRGFVKVPSRVEDMGVLTAMDLRLYVTLYRLDTDREGVRQASLTKLARRLPVRGDDGPRTPSTRYISESLARLEAEGLAVCVDRQAGHGPGVAHRIVLKSGLKQGGHPGTDRLHHPGTDPHPHPGRDQHPHPGTDRLHHPGTDPHPPVSKTPEKKTLTTKDPAPGARPQAGSRPAGGGGRGSVGEGGLPARQARRRPQAPEGKATQKGVARAREVADADAQQAFELFVQAALSGANKPSQKPDEGYVENEDQAWEMLTAALHGYRHQGDPTSLAKALRLMLKKGGAPWVVDQIDIEGGRKISSQRRRQQRSKAAYEARLELRRVMREHLRSTEETIERFFEDLTEIEKAAQDMELSPPEYLLQEFRRAWVKPRQDRPGLLRCIEGDIEVVQGIWLDFHFGAAPEEGEPGFDDWEDDRPWDQAPLAWWRKRLLEVADQEEALARAEAERQERKRQEAEQARREKEAEAEARHRAEQQRRAKAIARGEEVEELEIPF